MHGILLDSLHRDRGLFVVCGGPTFDSLICCSNVHQQKNPRQLQHVTKRRYCSAVRGAKGDRNRRAAKSGSYNTCCAHACVHLSSCQLRLLVHSLSLSLSLWRIARGTTVMPEKRYIPYQPLMAPLTSTRDTNNRVLAVSKARTFLLSQKLNSRDADLTKITHTSHTTRAMHSRSGPVTEIAEKLEREFELPDTAVQ